jgi:signal transduction histidine kinase
MRERLRPIGGRLPIHSSPLGGTRILVDVPLRAAASSPPPLLDVAAGR